MKVRTDLKSGDNSYTVQEGDTLTKIAQQFYGANATPEQVSLLYGVNDLVIGVDPCQLAPGEVLRIPTYAAPTPISPVPIPPIPPVPPTPHPKPKPPMVGACKEFWGNGQCLYKVCPYPPFEMPC